MKKVLIFVLLPLLLIIGSAAGIYFSGILGSFHEEESDGPKKLAPATAGTYFDIPDFIINLKGPQNKVVFLQLKLNIELKKPEDIDRCKINLPRFQDAIVTYFHRMDPDKLQDDPGFTRIRKDLARRMSASVKPPIEILEVNISDLRIQ